MATTINLQDIQFRRGTASFYTTSNPTLKLGEPAYEIDTRKLKIGDGVTPWISLGYVSGTGGVGGGAVDSVNGQTGIVVLDSDDIDDSGTNKFVTANDISKLSDLSGVNTGDQDISGIAINATNISLISSDIASIDSEIAALQASDSTQNTAIALNTAKVTYPGPQNASEVSLTTAVNGETTVQASLEDHESRIDALVSGGGSGDMLSANNLSDLTNTTTALTNLGFTSSITELNYTDGLTSSAQSQLDTLTSSVNGKQATLVSGTNIKTVNGNSLLGSGNITISGSGGGGSAEYLNTHKEGVNGTQNGVNTTFYVSQAIYNPTSLMVFRNGVAILRGDGLTESNPSAGEFTLDVAPEAEESLYAVYQTGEEINEINDFFTGYELTDGYEITGADFTTGKKQLWYNGVSDIEISIPTDVADVGEKLVLWQYGTGKIQVALGSGVNGIEFSTVDNTSPVTLTKSFDSTFGYRPIGITEEYTSTDEIDSMSNLVASWREEDLVAGSTTDWTDRINSYVAVAKGGITASSDGGSGVQFSYDGIDDAHAVDSKPSSLNFTPKTDSFSIAIKLGSIVPTTITRMIYKEDGGGTHTDVQYGVRRHSSSALYMYNGGGVNQIDISGDEDLTNDILVTTWSASTVTVYRNGTQIYQAAILAGTEANATSALSFAAANSGTSLFTAFSLKDVLIFNKELNSTEVTNIQTYL